MAEDWYVQDADGSIRGPLAERHVAVELLAGRIRDPQRVRQGETAEWCDASRARAVFERLAEVGWYIKEKDQLYGPFTDAKVLELYKSQEIKESAQLRQGTSGCWRPAHGLLSQWQQQALPIIDHSQRDGDKTMPSTSGKWSIAPIRHVFMEVQTETRAPSCRPHERLLLREDAAQTMVVERTCGQVVGRLSAEDARQLRFNSERGVTHLAFVVADRHPPRIAVVFCPPGADASMCHRYLEEHFLPPKVIP